MYTASQYNQHIQQLEDNYNADCEHYKCEIGRVEICKRCDNYCEEYLEDVDLEDLADEAIYLLEGMQEKGQITKNLMAINEELKRRSK